MCIQTRLYYICQYVKEFILKFWNQIILELCWAAPMLLVNDSVTVLCMSFGIFFSFFFSCPSWKTKIQNSYLSIFTKSKLSWWPPNTRILGLHAFDGNISVNSLTSNYKILGWGNNISKTKCHKLENERVLKISLKCLWTFKFWNLV